MITRFFDKDGAEMGAMPGRATLADLPDWVDASEVTLAYVIDADDVRAEAQRRIIALTGGGDLLGTIVKQSNANMRANELNDKRLSGDTLTTAEQVEADALRGLADAIKAVRAASNAIEPLDPIPTDYADDSRWP